MSDCLLCDCVAVRAALMPMPVLMLMEGLLPSADVDTSGSVMVRSSRYNLNCQFIVVYVPRVRIYGIIVSTPTGSARRNIKAVRCM